MIIDNGTPSTIVGKIESRVERPPLAAEIDFVQNMRAVGHDAGVEPIVHQDCRQD